MLTLDHVINTSAHHGCINHDNELLPALILLDDNPGIGMVEIDFVYHNNTFISSHDYTYENMMKGSSLDEWIDNIIPLGKIIWIDIKDKIVSIPFSELITVDVAKLYEYLDELKIKYPNLNDHILLSCQYVNVQAELVRLNTGYTIVHDVPWDYAYVLKEIMPLSVIKAYIHDNMIKYLKEKSGIVCIDQTFFETSTELYDFVMKLKQKTIILYSYEKDDDIIDTSFKFPDKHIIYQYNFVI